MPQGQRGHLLLPFFAPGAKIVKVTMILRGHISWRVNIMILESLEMVREINSLCSDAIENVFKLIVMFQIFEMR